MDDGESVPLLPLNKSDLEACSGAMPTKPLAVPRSIIATAVEKCKKVGITTILLLAALAALPLLVGSAVPRRD